MEYCTMSQLGATTKPRVSRKSFPTGKCNTIPGGKPLVSHYEEKAIKAGTLPAIRGRTPSYHQLILQHIFHQAPSPAIHSLIENSSTRFKKRSSVNPSRSVSLKCYSWKAKSYTVRDCRKDTKTNQLPNTVVGKVRKPILSILPKIQLRTSLNQSIPRTTTTSTTEITTIGLEKIGTTDHPGTLSSFLPTYFSFLFFGKKSDRVRAIEEKLGRPSYSDTSKRCSSVGPTSARPHARRSSIRSATTDHNLGGRETPHVPPREELHQLEKGSRDEPEQYQGHHDLSQLVEEQSQQLDDAPGRGRSAEEVLGLEPILRGTQVQSENKSRLHRYEPENHAGIATYPRTETIHLVSRTDPQESPKSPERAISETSSRRRRTEQHAVDVVLQPSLLPSNQGDQQVPEEQRKVPLCTDPRSTGSVQLEQKTFITTPSPFLASRRVVYENSQDVLSVPLVMNPTPASETNVPIQKVVPHITPPSEQNDVTSTLLSKKVVSPKNHVFEKACSPVSMTEKGKISMPPRNPHPETEENVRLKPLTKTSNISEQQFSTIEHVIPFTKISERVEPLKQQALDNMLCPRTMIDDSVKKTKSIEEILRETENEISPFLLAGPVDVRPLKMNPLSPDKELSLNNKFSALKIRSETTSPKSHVSVPDGELRMHETIKTLQSHIADISAIAIVLDDHQTNLTSNLQHLLHSQKEHSEVFFKHLGELMCVVGEKLDSTIQRTEHIQRNVNRLISMVERTNNQNGTSTYSHREHIPVANEPVILSNNPFAHEFPAMHQPQQPAGRELDINMPTHPAPNISKLNTDDKRSNESLAIIMTHSERAWYTSKRSTEGPSSWARWKVLIKAMYGTNVWKRRMSTAFDRDVFKWEHREKPLAWLLLQRRRMVAAWPSLTTSEQIDKILGLCHGDIEHAVQSRITDHSNYEMFMAIFEEVVTHTSIGKHKTAYSKRFTNESASTSNYKQRDDRKEHGSKEPKDRPTGFKPREKPFFKREDDRKPRTSDDDELVEYDTDTDSTDLAEEGNISLEELAHNLHIAEAEHVESNYPPFIEKFEIDAIDPSLFVSISINGIKDSLGLDTSTLSSKIPVSHLRICCPRWEADMRPAKDSENAGISSSERHSTEISSAGVQGFERL
ncbi:uncharacterized protein MELLADRAFT_114232 [Melampsora larici-populina 98AG31]|uniref:Uncharacterized protein n=1 Tax=Melampsora larici-populina (strain 98AG31 / pathotype 3-4-7) TaxID=747676 RepID=F4SCQ5_MELLP|nr:uncharacterized protein MELLADRAFT_114232 [Melampsora larici-populina 98AG31]EGF97574.1 hypothetical protein MELLADRAFT_114232 [Melampsora larici-populina 98AG31]